MTHQRMMVQTTQVEEIDFPEDEDHDHTTETGAAPRMTPLKQMKDQLGVVLVPNYLPQGFTLDESYVHMGRSARISYTSENTVLLFIQNTVPAHLNVKTGSVSRVQIGTGQGELVRGGWAQTFKDGASSAVEWDANSIATLLFEKDGCWMFLMAMGDQDVLPDAELIRIAESLAPY